MAIVESEKLKGRKKIEISKVELVHDFSQVSHNWTIRIDRG